VLAALQRDGGRVIRVVSEDLKDADAVAALRDRIIEVLE
jgi:4-hydroxy-3-methylbut-2-en-1-yl diphosphate synthase IspG/GcpE